MRDECLELGVMLEGVNGTVDGIIEVNVTDVDGVFCGVEVTGVTDELLVLVEDLIGRDGEVNVDPSVPDGTVVVVLNEVSIVVEPTDVVDDGKRVLLIGDETGPGGLIVVPFVEIDILVEPADEVVGEEAVPVNEGVIELLGRLAVLLIDIDGFVEPTDVVVGGWTVPVKVERIIELLDVPLLRPDPVFSLK